MDIKKVFNDAYKTDILPIQVYCDEIYRNNGFEACFCNVSTLIGKMESNMNPISDHDLEWILIELPMKLFTASESLNKLKLSLEVIKLKLKESKSEKDSDLETITEYQILKIIHETLISKVESQITLSKELIMGAKKVWDSRRIGEKSNPVKEIDLPDYDPNQTYIK